MKQNKYDTEKISHHKKTQIDCIYLCGRKKSLLNDFKITKARIEKTNKGLS